MWGEALGCSTPIIGSTHLSAHPWYTALLLVAYGGVRGRMPLAYTTELGLHWKLSSHVYCKDKSFLLPSTCTQRCIVAFLKSKCPAVAQLPGSHAYPLYLIFH